MFSNLNSQPSKLWPPPTEHRAYWENYNDRHVYEYDPTDDGPETAAGSATKAILASHTVEELQAERFETRMRRPAELNACW